MSAATNRSWDTQVLIAGAGPSGLTLACDLARRGVLFRIVDAAPRFFTGSRAKGLQPRSLEILDDLGVIEAVLASGGPYPPFRVYDGEKVVREGAMHEQREPTPDVPYANILMIPQWRTEEILRDQLAGYGIRVELATELTGFEQDGDGVTATLIHAGTTERVRAGYLVGADGGRSFVRRALGVGFEGETYETDRVLIGDVRADGLDREHWHAWGTGRDDAVALCPLPGTQSFQFTAPVDGVPDLSVQTVQEIFNERAGRSGVRLHDASWLSLYRANVRMVDRYRVGRVFLAGDAAHVHSPAGGQGMNTGIQDAYNLGWKLGQVLAGAPEELLDTYEEERLPIAAWVLGVASKYHAEAVRRKLGDQRRGSETHQLGLDYRGGPLARDEHDSPASVRAGDRAPDAPCRDAAGAPVRLFDVFRGPHFTLLAFGVAHAETVARVNARYGPTVHAHAVIEPGESGGENALVDVDGHTHTAYDVDGDALVLVRPDGYVGLSARPGTLGQLEDYLSLLTNAPQTVC
jgi:2-polyprenyl-6-methoxyphenol hydroxylase-like FAD-dependent oxidoreductase